MDLLINTESNAQQAWARLKLFGLRGKAQHLGFNRYSGKNSAVRILDAATGMILEVIGTPQVPKTERAYRNPVAIQFKTPGKRGRPAIHGCVQRVEFIGPKRKRGPKASTEPKEPALVFSGCHQKRGPKPLIS